MPRILDNPLIRLEFLRRFRSSMAAWGIPLLTVLPGIAVTIAYSAGTSSVFDNVMMMGGPDGGGGMGEVMNAVSVDQVRSFGLPMYIALFATVTFSLMILVPAVVGGSISTERSNMTLQPLQLTALRPIDIVTGKLVASMAYLLLLLLCLTPVLATPFLVGGVPVLEVVRSFGILVLICVELAAVALMVSSVLKKAATSIVTALIATGVVVIGPFLAMALAFYVQAAGQPFRPEFSASRYIACLSPVSLFSWAGDVEEFNPGEWAGSGIRVASLICWGGITIACLAAARLGVTAPVKQDR